MSLSFDFASLVKKENLRAAVSQAIGSDSVEVVHYDVNKATEEVEGFTSIMLRVKVDFIYKGDRFSKVVILKRMPVIQGQLEMIREIKAFEKELRVFSELLEEYVKLPVIDRRKLPFPKCYFTEADGTNDIIIMEDLRDSGFKLGDKYNGLDLEHCVLVMEELGKMHALSVILERKLNATLLEVYPFLSESFMKASDESKESAFATFFNDAIKGTVMCAETVPRLQSFLPALKKRFEGLWNEVCELVKPSDDYVNVLCHGDFHVNNMMFRYEKVGDKEKPVEVKFIDFQIARYATPATDIVYFLHSSTTPDLRKQHTNKILETYHKSFTSTFLTSGVNAPIFSYDDLLNCFDKVKPLGATVSCWLRLAVYTSEVEKLPKDFNEIDPAVIAEMFKGSYSDKLKRIFLQYETFRNRAIPLIEEAVELFGLKCSTCD